MRFLLLSRSALSVKRLALCYLRLASHVCILTQLNNSYGANKNSTCIGARRLVIIYILGTVDAGQGRGCERSLARS
ncbi:uncharacterized protein F4817DRAFT_351497 [Daldinia loculata]|uniref:uncharacterized protein n=1 Tax=Daldinia loculata TaxID=103429 RepID=UPI0020C3D612|nr:uncharacterized protein F4817DRAFT_351497 [Daldinia loculata]KAI1642916.1 hypothetical protein F4817DRAFT_351497 [Daldinia loculata]